jgi:hypothetical protein
MKKFFALFFLTVTALHAQLASLDLGSHGRIALYFPGGWKTNITDMAGQTTLTATPASEDANATLTLKISFPETDRYARKDKLKMQVEIAGAQYAESSVEGKAVGKPFDVKTGFGYHCDFTDRELVGQAPQKGNYKTITIGMIRLAPDVLVEVSLEADGFKSEPYQAMLGAIEGMEFKP